MIRTHGMKNRRNGGNIFKSNHLNEITIHGLDELGNAIVKQTVSDYRMALCGRVPVGWYYSLDKLIEECEAFFKSDLCQMIIGNGEEIMNKIKEEHKHIKFKVGDLVHDKYGYHSSLSCYMDDKLYQYYKLNGTTIESLEKSMSIAQGKFIADPYTIKLNRCDHIA